MVSFQDPLVVRNLLRVGFHAVRMGHAQFGYIERENSF